MAKRDEITAFCDDLLDCAAFEDYGPNGLQVPGAPEVERVASGVTANLELLERAVNGGAQLVITHHGLLWGDRLSPLSVPMASRLRTLLCADCSLAAYHLPLDAHPEIGNNALLRDALGLEPDERPFGRAKGSAIGVIGRAPEPLEPTELSRRLANAVGQEPLVFDAGPPRISTVGIVTGSGGFALNEAGRARPRRARHRRAERAGDGRGAGARDPLPGRRPLRDRDRRDQAAGRAHRRALRRSSTSSSTCRIRSRTPL